MKASEFAASAFVLFAISFAGLVGAEEGEAKRGFKSGELMNVPIAVVDLSEDGEAATFILRNAQVSVDRKGTSVQTLCIPFHLELTPGTESEEGTVFLQGYVDAQPGTTASAALHCFGKVYPIDLSKPDFEATFSGKVVASQDELIGTVCLVVQKSEIDDGGALLVLDSIDVWFGGQKPEKLAPKVEREKKAER